MNASPPSSSARKEPPQEKVAQKRVDGAAPPLGIVTEMRGATLVVGIQPSLSASLQIGELLMAGGVTMTVVGEVVSIQRAQHTHAEIKIVASIENATDKICPGAREIPGVGTHVHRPPPHVVQAISEDRPTLKAEAADSIRIALAQSHRYSNLDLSFAPERLIGRHVAVVGSSGGGKSCTVARLIEECSRHRSKLILLDLTGEYEPLEGPIFHTHLGQATREDLISTSVCLPFYELTESDLVALLEPESNLQLLKLQSAMRTLKLLHLEPKLATEGVFPKAHKEKRLYEQSIDDYKHELEVPENLFDLYKLPLQIELECVDVYRSQTETGFWGGINHDDLAQCSPLIHRAGEIFTRGDLGAIFLPHTSPSLVTTIESFLSDESFGVLRISFEFLPLIHHIREIVANAIGRRLLDMGRQRLFMNQPVLLMVDEAHQVLHPSVSQFTRDFPLNAYHLIAKEGRKYGLSLAVATQRPGDIPEDILSQMGTFIVHRLVGMTDRAIVEKATGACDKATLEDLPTLTPGEAIIVGSSFSRPLRVMIKLPTKLPFSHGPNYQTLWKQ